MIKPFVLSGLVLVALLIACSVIWSKSHMPIGLDPYGCFGAGRYDAMRERRVCKGFK